MRYLIALGFIIISFSCSKNEKLGIRTFKKFPKEINLLQEEVKTKPVLYFVAGMALMDSILITVDLKSDIFFQVFKLPAYNYLGGFMPKGKGPEEELSVDPYIQHIGSNKILYRSATSIKIAKFNVEKNKIEVLDKMNLPGELMNLSHIFKLGDCIYGSNLDMKTEKEFVGYNPKTKKIFDFGQDYPKVDKTIDVSKRNMVFAKAIAVKPDATLFAAVYDKFPILRIYSKDGILKNEVRFDNNQSFPEALLQSNPSELSIGKLMQNYRMIRASNRFIYALYIGKTSGEMKMNERGLDDFSNEIHVWDWEGNPVMKILLDRKIFTFDVVADDNYLICTSLNSIDKIYKYSIHGDNN